MRIINGSTVYARACYETWERPGQAAYAYADFAIFCLLCHPSTDKADSNTICKEGAPGFPGVYLQGAEVLIVEASSAGQICVVKAHGELPTYKL